MEQIFNIGDTKTFSKVVQEQDIAAFESGTVHDVYATFSIARDAEWSGRLFVLDMKEEDEEGIGTSITVDHVSPAFIGDTIVYTAEFVEINERREIITTYKAYCGERLIAKGVQGQKILKKIKIDALFEGLKKG